MRAQPAHRPRRLRQLGAYAHLPHRHAIDLAHVLHHAAVAKLRVVGELVHAEDAAHRHVAGAAQVVPPIVACACLEDLAEGVENFGVLVRVELVFDELLASYRPAEGVPEPGLDAAEAKELAVLALEHVVVGNAAVEGHQAALGHRAGVEVLGQRGDQHIGDAVGHGDVHVLAAPGVVARHERREYADGGLHSAAGVVGYQVVRYGWRPALGAYHAERAAGADVVYVVADQALVRAVLAVARYGAVDQPRVQRAERLVVAAQPFGHARAKALDEHVGVLAQPPQHVPGLGNLEVERNAALVAVQRGEGRAAALLPLIGVVAPAHARSADASAARLLDADDVCPEVSEHHRAEASRRHAREVDHADVGQLKRPGVCVGGVSRCQEEPPLE